LLAGDPPGFASKSASSAEASLHAALAARRGIFVQRRFPMADRTVRAAESRFPMPQFFAVAASALDHQARHAEALYIRETPWLAADPLRSSLREPNLTP
jgi:hypothetical protein